MRVDQSSTVADIEGQDASQTEMSQLRRSAGSSRGPRPARPATPRPSTGPLRPMPRQAREAPPPQGSGGHRRTVLGRPWVLPVSPLTTLLALAFVVALAAAWRFEGRFETPPADAAKQLLAYKASDLQSVQVTMPAGSITYERDASGKFSAGGAAASPIPTSGSEGALAPVTLSPSTKLEGIVNQLNGLRIDLVVLNEPSISPDFGLDQPQLTLKVTPRSGPPATLAIGQANPDRSSYYVRREERRDTVLASRYTLDDLIKVAGELIAGSLAASP